MDRKYLLAAEAFNYSYNKYADKLDIRAKRFSQYMPDDIVILEKAERDNWSFEQLAEALEMEPEKVEFLLRGYERAKDIIDAPSPAESFRRGVRHSIRYAIKEGLESDEDIEKLVVQICYRAADLSYLLDIKNQKLSEYSEELREIPSDLDLLDNL
ncbi:hypothetical protein [Rhodohalobacter sp. 8-1]|uniref:hypothetical protein n=1 Tax=Rhodohalobacter sp. 8-1 TaxID=3131972 RepID=UPI0030ECECF5